MRSFLEVNKFLSSVSPGVKIGGILCLGLLLILLSGMAGEGQEKPVGEEEKAAELCSLIDGVGECRVMMTYDGEEVFAVLVLCDGGESVAVRERITSVFCALYGIGAHRVEIQRLCP